MSEKIGGFVYVLGGSGYLKIGKTINLSKRICIIAPNLPFMVSISKVIYSPDHHSLEREIHERFALKRLYGEWFRLDREDLWYLDSLAQFSADLSSEWAKTAVKELRNTAMVLDHPFFDEVFLNPDPRLLGLD